MFYRILFFLIFLVCSGAWMGIVFLPDRLAELLTRPLHRRLFTSAWFLATSRAGNRISEATRTDGSRTGHPGLWSTAATGTP